MSQEAVDQMFAGLSAEQIDAVTHLGCPLMIVAGAGTGKTHVLTSRILWLVLSGRARPEEILALTFTEKAAHEMSDRIERALPSGSRGVEVGTFHAFCDRLLRRHALEMGLEADFSVLSAGQAKLLLRECLFALPLDRYRPRADPLSYLAALTRHFDKAKNAGVRPHDYLRWCEELHRELENDPRAGPADWDRWQRQRELAQSYQVYQQLLSQRGYLDFGDQILSCLDLFEASPHLLENLRQRYRYVLIDEFQDTNASQFELVHRLVGDGERLTVVGDDDQAIYSFRGASLANVLDFGRVFPHARQLVLRDNYRSSQPILDLAYRGICHNNPDRLEVRQGLDKRLRAVRDDLPLLSADPVEVGTFATLTDEADAVAERIEQLLSQGAVEYQNCAILVRNNSDAKAYQKGLESRGIPYRFQGSHGLYDRPEIRLLLAFARTVSDPLDSISCYHLAASGLFGLGLMKLRMVNAYARRQSVSLYAAMSEHRQVKPGGGVVFEPSELLALKSFLDLLEGLAGRLTELSPRAMLHAFLVESGWMARLSSEDTPEAVAEARNLARFFEIVGAQEQIFPDHRLPQLIEQLDQLRQAGDSPAVVESDHQWSAVSILTVHGAKGLEFSAVFLVGLSAGRFPNWRREDPLEFPAELLPSTLGAAEERHLAEERRLFYVAVTRAKQLLWLSMAFDEGRKRSNQISPFLKEALQGRSTDFRPQRHSPIEQLGRHAAPPLAQQAREWGTMSSDRPLRLTWSKLELYWKCPRQYFYREVLQLALPPSHQADFGQALHEAIRTVLTLKQQGVEVSLEEVQAGFRTRWRRAAGCLSPDHQADQLSRGLAMISHFWESEKSRPVPRYVERDFRVALEGNNWLDGRWDRVDELQGVWTITDYKSSEVTSQEQADARAQGSQQLVLYALALEGTVGVRPARVSLDFLGRDWKGVRVVEDQDLRRLRSEIGRAAQGMRARDYPARANYRNCQSCAFRAYCPESAVT